jgi:hypothetical protein
MEQIDKKAKRQYKVRTRKLRDKETKRKINRAKGLRDNEKTKKYKDYPQTTERTPGD